MGQLFSGHPISRRSRFWESQNTIMDTAQFMLFLTSIPFHFLWKTGPMEINTTKTQVESQSYFLLLWLIWYLPRLLSRHLYVHSWIPRDVASEVLKIPPDAHALDCFVCLVPVTHCWKVMESLWGPCVRSLGHRECGPEGHWWASHSFSLFVMSWVVFLCHEVLPHCIPISSKKWGQEIMKGNL